MTPFVAALVPKAFDLISEFITDKDKANEIAHKIATQAEENAHQINLAQIQVNQVEAAHKSLFVAGWRPFIGWVCGAAMACNYLVFPVAGVWLPELKPLDTATMFPVLLGLLGLGGLRTTEKVKQVSREK